MTLGRLVHISLKYFVIVFQTNLSQFGSNLFTARDSRVIGPPNDLTVSIHSPSSGQAEMKPWSRLPSSTMWGGGGRKDGRHRERGGPNLIKLSKSSSRLGSGMFSLKKYFGKKIF